MRNTKFWWILIGLMITLDVYVFQAVRILTLSASPRVRTIVHTGYWAISVACLVVLLLLPYFKFTHDSWISRNTIFFSIIGIFFAKVIAAVFFLIDDIRRLFQWISWKLGWYQPVITETSQGGITRSVFLSWTGMIFGGGLFGTLLYGFGNKYKYQLNHVAVDFPTLPGAFRGLKVIHISDIHAGSFNDKKAVARGVEKIMAQNPDLILFTGDLVNNKAEEMDEYREVFSKLQAPMGVYSILGNHDYGDYVAWDSPEQKIANMEALKKVHADMGWRLLLNEHVILEKDGERIALIGIENWGAKANFPKYGKLKEAYAGTEDVPFKILMSHDPSHWDAEVRKEFQDIDLMLSGHTHGMQFGVEIPGFKWSPVQYVYDQWAGLYEDGKQKLYINRGYGFLAYPGRVGILPEITLLELA